jgi:hypothetical protein
MDLLKDEFDKMKFDYQVTINKLERERNEYKTLYNESLEVSNNLAEEVIILRNQLDKFLHYKK